MNNNNFGIIMYSNPNSFNSSPVCCAVIPSRYGIPLVLTIWIVISIYFATLSFMKKSPFYSYIDMTTIYVFGALNIFLVILCLYGYSIHWIKRSVSQYRQYAKIFACCIAIILMDIVANFITFVIKKEEFVIWCTSTSMYMINQSLRSSLTNSTTTAMTLNATIVAHPDLTFNCSRLYEADIKFSAAITLFMVIVYIHWTAFIISDSRNFILMRPEISITRSQLRNSAGTDGSSFYRRNQEPVELTNIRPSNEV
ncbi:MAG: hypothetical protein EXX96DRAFT_578137 [Benjaminiella poitrasii]|nr:MAG: hypothetical protein EXX96DRAFT_578137 [Benjaminiella poitrasii]